MGFDMQKPQPDGVHARAGLRVYFESDISKEIITVLPAGTSSNDTDSSKVSLCACDTVLYGPVDCYLTICGDKPLLPYKERC